jgi:F-type H+-transporting ATPase subunit alpha
VSRVGGAAQIKAMKSVAGTLRLDLAQFREMEAFAQFGSDLDEATQKQLARGERLVEVLKQGQYVPQDVAKQIVVIYAATKGYIDTVEASAVGKYEEELLAFVSASHPDLFELIKSSGKLDDTVEAKLKSVLEEFRGIFVV